MLYFGACVDEFHSTWLLLIPFLFCPFSAGREHIFQTFPISFPFSLFRLPPVHNLLAL